MEFVKSLGGRRVYLDTNVFIYALSGFPTFVPLLTELFDAIEAKSLVGVTSELALAEALVLPFRNHDADEEQRCREIFREGPSMELHPVSMGVLETTARMRAATPTIRTPDAIHAATAQLAQCEAFLTNDANLKSLPGLTVFLLSDAVKQSP